MKINISRGWEQIRSFQRSLLLFCVTLSVGCASTYRGPKPDLALTGEAAEKEVEEFTMSRSKSHFKPGVHLGSDKSAYTFSSVKPIIEEVSPKAYEHYLDGKRIHRNSLLLFAAGVGVIVLAFQDPNGSGLTRSGYNFIYLLGGTFVGLGFIQQHFFSSMIDQYNEDLRNRMVPQLSWSIDFD